MWVLSERECKTVGGEENFVVGRGERSNGWEVIKLSMSGCSSVTIHQL